ncbi:hypothetical protein H2O64_05320 [Kordia sp. YSTF-M3]|uniref:Bacteriocin n=1 Tax=Kordia aestuariivivens TaxID=2759037 RepID=A0ABR7Q6B6_9FLAO|nr:hypothetical protein [Kordia aestuariivivens]MBC8754080.1 hypothetical protein [Kordia aestuariivivens]
MKKKKLKILKLNKSAVSIFDSILGGRENCSDGETCPDNGLNKPIRNS